MINQSISNLTTGKTGNMSLSIMSRYVIMSFVKYFIAISLVTILILLVANTFDVIYKFQGQEIDNYIFWSMIFFKTPQLFDQVILLIIFITNLVTLHNFIRNNEMIIMVTHGFSLLKMMMITLFITFIISIFTLLVIHPFGTYSIKKVEELQDQMHGNEYDILITHKSGIYIFESHIDENYIIRADNVNINSKILYNPILLVVNKNNDFIKQITAEELIISNKNLIVNDASVVDKDNPTNIKKLPIVKMKTRLSTNDILKQFAEPEEVNIFEIPSLIKYLSSLKIPTQRYEMFFYKNIFKPIVMLILVMTTFSYISFDNRSNTNLKLIFFGLLSGIFIYFFVEIVPKMLVYRLNSPMLANLIPVLFIAFFYVFVILHKNES